MQIGHPVHYRLAGLVAVKRAYHPIYVYIKSINWTSI